MTNQRTLASSIRPTYADPVGMRKRQCRKEQPSVGSERKDSFVSVQHNSRGMLDALECYTCA